MNFAVLIWIGLLYKIPLVNHFSSLKFFFDSQDSPPVEQDSGAVLKENFHFEKIYHCDFLLFFDTCSWNNTCSLILPYITFIFEMLHSCIPHKNYIVPLWFLTFILICYLFLNFQWHIMKCCLKKMVMLFSMLSEEHWKRVFYIF